MVIYAQDPLWIDSINAIRTIIAETNHVIEEIKINNNETFSVLKVIQIREKLKSFVKEVPSNEKVKYAFEKVSILSDKTFFYSVKMATSIHYKYMLDEFANIK